MPYNHKEQQKQDSSQKYPIMLNGEPVQLSEEQIGQVIKQKMAQDPAILKLFKMFGISVKELNELKVEIVDLQKMFAQTDQTKMQLDVGLFKSPDCLGKSFYIIAHEIVHFLTRQKEAQNYMNDPEEMLGFSSSIAYLLMHNDDLDSIYNKIYPKIKWHFHSERDAHNAFMKMVEDARKIIAQ
jgi:hypothetical protein